jgi:hypothetical protein
VCVCVSRTSRAQFKGIERLLGPLFASS